MFRGVAPELIPANGAEDLTNLILDEQNVGERRGGTAYIAASAVAGTLRLLWSGFLKHGGQTTVLCTSAGSWKVEADGKVVSITLTPPVALAVPTVFQGILYFENRSWDGEKQASATAPKYVATAANRLARGEGARVDVSSVPTEEGEAFTFPATNYFSLPHGAEIVGMHGLRTSVVVFTTAGIWLLSGLEHEIVDAEGNVQWRQDLYSADASVWGVAGVAAWRGGLIVPCRDEVRIMEVGVSSERAIPFRPITGPIRALYREYVAKGYVPGGATVANAHYLLPILNGAGTVVDMLVCRLEDSQGRASAAWSHFTGPGAEMAVLTSTVSDLEGLIGAPATTPRVQALSYLKPGKEAQDAGAHEIGMSLITRSIATGGLVGNTVAKVRLRYSLEAPGASRMLVGFASASVVAQWGAFNWGEGFWGSVADEFGDLGDAVPVPAGPDPQASTSKTWHVGRKVRFARMKIELSGPAVRASIRSVELAVRPDGRVF